MVKVMCSGHVAWSACYADDKLLKQNPVIIQLWMAQSARHAAHVKKAAVHLCCVTSQQGGTTFSPEPAKSYGSIISGRVHRNHRPPR